MLHSVGKIWSKNLYIRQTELMAKRKKNSYVTRFVPDTDFFRLIIAPSVLRNTKLKCQRYRDAKLIKFFDIQGILNVTSFFSYTQYPLRTWAIVALHIPRPLAALTYVCLFTKQQSYSTHSPFCHSFTQYRLVIFPVYFSFEYILVSV